MMNQFETLAKKVDNLGTDMDPQIADMAPEVAAYCAGIFDASGTLNIYKLPEVDDKNPSIRFILKINHTHHKFPHAFKDLTGVGFFYKDNGITKWKCANKKEIKLLLEHIKPYVILKKKQVEIVLEAMKDDENNIDYHIKKLHDHASSGDYLHGWRTAHAHKNRWKK
jgi:hypothetical protein